MKKLKTKDYKDLYRRFKTQQYTLRYKGYAVYNYTFDEFVDIYNEERRYRSKLTKEEKKKKRSVLETVVNSSKIYTRQMAEIMAEQEGVSTKQWMRETMGKVYTGTFIKSEGLDEKEAAKIRQAIFDYFLAQTGDYNIAHAKYMTTISTL